TLGFRNQSILQGKLGIALSIHQDCLRYQVLLRECQARNRLQDVADKTPGDLTPPVTPAVDQAAHSWLWGGLPLSW
ncbi:MAG: hypothetical protein U1F59_14035, partial [Candidatus Competibacteraceae bacterium]